MAVKLLPNYLHVCSIGFATALGAAGGAVFQFAVDTIEQVSGFEVLQPVVSTLLLGVMALWLAFPRQSKRTT